MKYGGAGGGADPAYEPAKANTLGGWRWIKHGNGDAEDDDDDDGDEEEEEEDGSLISN